MKTKLKLKKYKTDGIPLRIQELRTRPRTPKENLELRFWLVEYKKRPDHRPETVEAYTI